MIQAAQGALEAVVVDLRPAIVTVTRARLARDESVGTNPEFCQGFQIALVSA